MATGPGTDDVGSTTNHRPLRVLFVLDSLGPGGTERSTALSLGPLLGQGILAEVACLRRAERGDEARVRSEGFAVHVLESRSVLGQVAELRRIIRRSRPDVVHTAIYRADIVGRLAACSTRTPVVSSLISTPYAPARRDDPRVTSWKLAVARYIDGLTARHCTTRLHAVSAGTARVNCRDLRLDPARVTVVERGRPEGEFTVVDDRTRAAARTRLGIAATDRVVVSLGRQAQPKAFPDLMHAARLLVRTVPDARVLIAGAPGPATPDVEAAHRALPADVAARVELLGHRDDVADLLHASNVFALASRIEGTAGSVIEAMACGLPVVVTAVDGLEGIVRDGAEGLVVPVGNPNRLAEALARVLTDPVLARRLGERGRRTFLERFTLERSVEGMAALYREVATSAPARR